jgi:phenylacetate-CoA ligase
VTTAQAIAQFASTPLKEQLSRGRQLSAQTRVLDSFRHTVQEVPAYREFLATQSIDPTTVKTYADFKRLPLLMKQNYINKARLILAREVFSEEWR